MKRFDNFQLGVALAVTIVIAVLIYLIFVVSSPTELQHAFYFVKTYFTRF